MSATHPLAAEIARLNALEREIIERYSDGSITLYSDAVVRDTLPGGV